MVDRVRRFACDGGRVLIVLEYVRKKISYDEMSARLAGCVGD